MVTQANGKATSGDPRAVGNTFIDQYYNVLKQSPQMLHRFYTDISELSRPGPDGEMNSVTTVQGINDKILSMGFENYHLQILTADAQASHEGGVSVLVTGRLTGKDDFKRTFSQSFFLAPQDNGFFVLNDIFRYVEGESAASVSAFQEDVDDAKSVEVSVPDAEPENIVAPEVDHPEVEVKLVDDAEELAVVKEDIAESFSNDISPEDAEAAVLAPASDDGQATAPKKSFASIVSALKQSSVPFHARAPLAKPPAQARAVTTPEVSMPHGFAVSERTENAAAKRYSIFVGNLPLDAAPAQLEAAFKKFGPIKQNGIQVRSSKGSCYGFVEFESESAMRSALEETSIFVGKRMAHIEEQKRDSSVDRGRGGFRNEQYRNRGGFPGRGGFNRDGQNGGRRGPPSSFM